MYIHICICIKICIYKKIFVYVCMHTHIHIFIHTSYPIYSVLAEFDKNLNIIIPRISMYSIVYTSYICIHYAEYIHISRCIPRCFWERLRCYHCNEEVVEKFNEEVVASKELKLTETASMKTIV